MTIYEAFKNMTIDELTIFLFPQGSSDSCPLCKLNICECGGYPNFDESKKYCFSKIKDWLNSEVNLNNMKLLVNK